MIYDFAVSLRDGRRIVGTGGKIALGCGIALIAGGIAAVVGLGGLAFWARNKAHQLTSEQNRIAELQSQGDCFYFIANYHAQTTVRELAERMSVEQSRKLKAADLLRQHTLDVALDYLALGLDPSRATFNRIANGSPASARASPSSFDSSRNGLLR